MKLEEQVSIVKGRKYVPIGLILPDLNQPRKAFSEEKLKEMAESIKANGIIQDLIVEPLFKPAGHYLLIDGERRWRAAKLAGLPVVPITERTDVNEKSRAVVQSVANQQHENLSALEEAAAYQRQIDKGWHTAETLYKALGISRATLFARLALNRLTPEVRKAVEAGKISVSVAGLVAMIPGVKEQQVALQEVSDGQWGDGPMSFREARDYIEHDYCRSLKKPAFDVTRVYEGEFKEESKGGNLAAVQLRSRGPCTTCPYRSGNMEGIEASDANTCTRPRCFEAKVLAATAEKIGLAKKTGKKVLEPGQAFTKYGSLKGEYIEPNDSCPQTGYAKSWEEALGRLAPTKVVAPGPSGELKELFVRTEAIEALKKSGLKLEPTHSGQPGGDNDYRKRQATCRLRVKAAMRAAGPMLDKLVKDGTPADKVWPLLARAAYDCTSIDQHAFVAKRRGLTEVQTDARQKMDKLLKGMTSPAECAALVVELLLCARHGVSTWGTSFDKDFTAAAALAKVDMRVIEEELKQEKAAKKKGKKTTEDTKDTKAGKAVKK